MRNGNHQEYRPYWERYEAERERRRLAAQFGPTADRVSMADELGTSAITRPFGWKDLGVLPHDSWGGGPEGDGTDLNGAAPCRKRHRQPARDYQVPDSAEDLFYRVSGDEAWSLPPFSHSRNGRGHHPRRAETERQLPPGSFASDFAILSESGEFDVETAHTVVFTLAQDDRGALIRAEVRHGLNGTSHTRVVEFRPEGSAIDWAERLNAVQRRLETISLRVIVLTPDKSVVGHNPRKCRKCASQATTRAERAAHYDPNAESEVVWSG